MIPIGEKPQGYSPGTHAMLTAKNRWSNDHPRPSPRNLSGSFTLPLDAFCTVNFQKEKKIGQHVE